MECGPELGAFTPLDGVALLVLPYHTSCMYCTTQSRKNNLEALLASFLSDLFGCVVHKKKSNLAMYNKNRKESCSK